MNRSRTMRDVAREADVAQSTVSRALRDDPRITPAERERIKAVAERIGYRPNPYVAAFAAQVLHRRRAPRGATIALLDANPAGAADYGPEYRAGARRRAEELGYRCELIRLASLGGSARRLRQVLDARGIVAVLVLPVAPEVDLTALDFRGLAVATVDPTLHRPILPRAEPDYFGAMWRVLDELEARGYRRAAFCTTRGEVDSMGRQWLGAFAGWQALRPRASRMEPYIGEDYGQDAFARWLEAARPDALVVNSLCFLSWARKRGLRPPATGFATVCADGRRRPRMSGVAQGHEEVAAAAVDLIVTRIHRNEFGLPARARRLLVDGEWFEGGTVRKRPASAS